MRQRTAKIAIRTTHAMRAAWQDAAKLDGRSLASWIERRLSEVLAQQASQR
jgi:predicted HicB family RNase H-like nuclease